MSLTAEHGRVFARFFLEISKVSLLVFHVILLHYLIFYNLCFSLFAPHVFNRLSSISRLPDLVPSCLVDLEMAWCNHSSMQEP